MKKTLITAGVIIAIGLSYSFGKTKFSSREYIIVQEPSKEKFQSRILAALRADYQLAGGVTYIDGSYTQAVYK